ncbi:MAG: PAS domain S-box protein [Chloroflexota bacterium]|nr:PAS domain S-box protein [Chloroflexota bacterium]
MEKNDRTELKPRRKRKTRVESNAVKRIVSLEWCPVAMCLIRQDGILISANHQVCELLGYSKNGLAGLGIRSLCIDPSDWDIVEADLYQSGGYGRYEVKMRNKDGSEIVSLCTVAIERGIDELAECYACVIHDITGDKRVLERLRGVEKFFYLLAENLADGLWTIEWDADMNIHMTYLSPAIKNVIGYEPEEAKRVELFDLMTKESLQRGLKILNEQFELEREGSANPSRSWAIDVELYHKNGTMVWAEVRTTFIRNEDGRAIGLAGVTRDITERKMAEAVRRMLSSRLMEVQEEERKNIARELHDQIGQMLTGLKLSLELLPGLPPQDTEARLEEAQSLIRELMDRTRRLSLELRPSTLDDLGLLPSFLDYFARYTHQTRIQVKFKQRGLRKRFPREIETAVYRIVQEGLTNIARHASVSEAAVRITADRSQMKVEIKDNGVGFRPKVKTLSSASMGLAGMRERASLLGGRFAIDSAPGKGTRLVVELPLEAGTNKK